MTTRKHQNSILVLATLGVYLGLVLVGATPQVMAQAAMTKQFSVKDEVEVTDELDKKPDPSIDELVSAYDNYFRNVKDFFDDLGKLSRIEKFDSSWNAFDTQTTSFSPCPETGTLVSVNKRSNIDRWVLPAIEQAEYATESGFWLSDCIPKSGPDKRTARGSGLELSYDKTSLSYKVSFIRSSSQRADLLHEHLSRALEVYDVDEDDSILRVLFQNTTLTKSNNQIFIITRLPRAGLDALLASEAK